jgi:hypothetical protein
MTRTPRPPRLRVEPLEDRSVPAVITVTTLADVTAPGDGQLTLREALAAANANSPGVPPDPDVLANTVGPFGDDTIRFAAGLVGTIALAGGALLVTDPVTVEGAGRPDITISGAGADRVFLVDAAAGAVTLRSLTVADGRAADGPGGGVVSRGAALTVERVTFARNRATAGGAIDSDGPLTVSDSAFENNAAAADGGAVRHAPGRAGAVLRLTNVTFAGNTAAGRGGGLFVGSGPGPARLVHVTASGNTAADGGGVASETGLDVLLFNSVVAGNTATDVEGFADLAGGRSEGGNVLGAVDPDTLTGLRPSDVAGVADPGLGALDLFGGPVPVFALVAGSPALGRGLSVGDPPAGIPAEVAPPADARGRPRPSAGAIDAGAFQAQRPSAAPDAFTTPAGRPLTVPPPGVFGNDAGNDVFGPLAVAGVTPPPPAEGTLALNPDGSFTFTPAAGFAGVTTFGYTVSDRVTTAGPVTVTITVTNLPPVAVPDAYTVGQNRPLTVPAPGVLANDTDPDDTGPLTAALVGGVAPAGAGTVALNADGSFVFTPAAGFVGTATFGYAASDGIAASPPTTVTITVTPAVPPVVNPDGYVLGGAPVLTVPAPGVLANDAAGDIFGPLVAVLDTAPPPAAGTVTLNADGSFTFTAARTFSGTATFTYRATDGVTTSGPVTVTITGTAAARLYAFGAGAGPGSVARVRAFASDGSPRFDFLAFEPGFDGGVRVAVGDVTGDRVDDIVAAAGPGGGPRVAVFDGATGVLVRSFFAYEPTFGLGVHVAAADLDGDGFADIVTGTGSGGGPRVQAFSGRTGGVLANFFPYDPRFRGGVRVGAGDLDRDGRAEVVTAAGPSGGPDIGVFDAAGNPLARFFGFDPAYRGGVFVSVGRAGDGTARVYLAPDSFPDFRGSVLGDQFPELADTAGVPPGVPAEAGRLVGPPRVYVFAPAADARSFAAEAEVPVLGGGADGGVRVAAGTFGADVGVFVASGPGGGSRVQFLPYRAGGLAAPTLDVPAFDPAFPHSVYVGAGSRSV